MAQHPKKLDFEAALRQLKRGLMTGDDRASLPAYQVIYHSGAVAVPIIEKELSKFDLKQAMRKESGRLFSGLLALHRDLDESASNQFIDAHVTLNYPTVTDAILRSVRRIESSDFRKATWQGIDIWEHKSLDKRYEASGKIKSWLGELPDRDVQGIVRIYVQPHDLDKDWLGQYLPGLAVVTLAWWTILPPGSWFNRLINKDHKYTLFHEVGHHVNRHWVGQDPQAEAEADAYAYAASINKPMWLRLLVPTISLLPRRSVRRDLKEH